VSIPQTRTALLWKESPSGLFRQVLSTSFVHLCVLEGRFVSSGQDGHPYGFDAGTSKLLYRPLVRQPRPLRVEILAGAALPKSGITRAEASLIIQCKANP